MRRNKYIVGIAIIIFIALCVIVFKQKYGADTVSLSTTVVEKKPTDTINDFDLNSKKETKPQIINDNIVEKIINFIKDLF